MSPQSSSGPATSGSVSNKCVHVQVTGHPATITTQRVCPSDTVPGSILAYRLLE